MMAITDAGTVVHNICLICSYNPLPAAIGARFVVSDKGDNLSPKYAPATIAPAVAGRLASRPVAIPITATPTVPTDPHDAPLTIDIMPETTKAIKTMNVGLISSSP